MLSGDRSTDYTLHDAINTVWVTYHRVMSLMSVMISIVWMITSSNSHQRTTDATSSTVLQSKSSASRLRADLSGVDKIYVSYKPEMNCLLPLLTMELSASTQGDKPLFLNDDRVLLGPKPTGTGTLYQMNIPDTGAGFFLSVSIPDHQTANFGNGFETPTLERGTGSLELSQLTIDGETMGNVNFTQATVRLEASARYTMDTGVVVIGNGRRRSNC